MKILVLNGSPRPEGNTSKLIEAYKEGAEEAGTEVTVYSVCSKHIAGCRGCEYCHTAGNGKCRLEDDMGELLELLSESDMLVLASPIYYFGLTAQLQAAIQRTYAIGIPKKLRRSAMILSSGSDNIYGGAMYEYDHLVEYMKLESIGICTAYGSQNGSAEKLEEARGLGRRSA